MSPLDAETLLGHDRRWVLPRQSNDAVCALRSRLDCPELLARLLLARGFDEPAAAAYLSALPGARRHIEGTERAVERIERAVARRELIFIHGDYDVDGITASALLRLVLERLGAQVTVFLPLRTVDGYGVAERGLQAALDAGAALLITADCGATAGDVFARLRSRGCDSIVTDHHIQEASLDGPVAVLNPVQPGDASADRDLAAVGVAAQLGAVLLERRGESLPPLAVALAAIGTIADVAPLRGQNRDLVRGGLAALSACPNAGLTGLMQKARVDPSRVRASQVAFQIAPRLNAAGRLDNPRKAFDLFFEPDPLRLHTLLNEIEQLNTRRQKIEEDIMREAERSIQPSEPALVLDGEGWERGVIGIVASRLVERYHRPALVVSRQGGDLAFGSARSVAGLNIVDCLRSSSAVLLSYGGHEQAAGFTLPAQRLPEFRRRITEAVLAAGGAPAPEYRLDAELPESEVSFEAAESLLAMEPCGRANPEPLFLLRGARVREAPGSIGETGLKFHLRLDRSGRNLSAVAWRKRGWRLPIGRPVDFAGRLQIRDVRGLKELQFTVEDYRDGD